MTEYKTKRIIDKKPPPRWVIVDRTGKVVNKNPSNEQIFMNDNDEQMSN